MTICIAAVCESGHAIVMAADKEFGIGFTSTEFPEGKLVSLAKDWSVGIAGTVSNATDVIFEFRKQPLRTTSVIDVRPTLELAYRQARLSRAEGRFLANRGWTLSDFNMFGSSRMSQGTYATIDTLISSFDFDADLIVAGFGENDDGPSILTVRNPGIAVDHSKLGFWCVGSGSTLAQTSLFSRKYSWMMQAEEAAFYVLEAKLTAQPAMGVGIDTDLIFIRKGMAPIIVRSPTESNLRTIYEELRPKSFTPNHRDRLRTLPEFEILRRPA